jgi:hypothetical protein
MTKKLIIFFVILTPSISYAYVGPGVGLTALLSLLTLGSAFFVALFGFIWLPVKQFFQDEKADEENKDDAPQEDENDESKKE